MGARGDELPGRGGIHVRGVGEQFQEEGDTGTGVTSQERHQGTRGQMAGDTASLFAT